MISRNNKGITLIALVITIVVLLIIASITIVGGIEGADTAAENKLLSELDMVQHAVLQRYIKVQMTKEDVPGQIMNEIDDVNRTVNLINETLEDGNKISLKINEYTTNNDKYQYYYELTPDTLKDLGITNAQDTYIVNYSTGEVINKTTPQTKSGEPLYICAKTE